MRGAVLDPSWSQVQRPGRMSRREMFVVSSFWVFSGLSGSTVVATADWHF